MLMRIFTVLLVIGSALWADLNAQHTTLWPKKGKTPPNALLVTLLTRQGQREFLERARPELLPEFDRDVTEVLNRTVRDYSRYFHFCPVYFFIDSMSDKIALGEYQGVVLDSSLQPVADAESRLGARKFFIAHYGSPFPQPDSVRPTTGADLSGQTEMNGDDPTALFRERLVVCDADFNLLSGKGPRTNFVHASPPSLRNPRDYRIYRRSIVYNAKRWYIDYQPTAYGYSRTLKKYYSRSETTGEYAGH